MNTRVRIPSAPLLTGMSRGPGVLETALSWAVSSFIRGFDPPPFPQTFINSKKMDKRTRRRLELLADRGVLPSSIGVDTGDDTEKFMDSGIDIDDAGVVMRYDSEGGDEIDAESTTIFNLPILSS